MKAVLRCVKRARGSSSRRVKRPSLPVMKNSRNRRAQRTRLGCLRHAGRLCESRQNKRRVDNDRENGLSYSASESQSNDLERVGRFGWRAVGPSDSSRYLVFSPRRLGRSPYPEAARFRLPGVRRAAVAAVARSPSGRAAKNSLSPGLHLSPVSRRYAIVRREFHEPRQLSYLPITRTVRNESCSNKPGL